MPFAELTENRLLVQTEHREKEEIKQVPGAIWDNNIKRWEVPKSWAACVQLRGIFQERLQVGEQLNAWVGEELEQRINPCLALRTAEDAPELALLSALHPFQRAGVQFMVSGRRVWNGDEMRLGKTVQSIAALQVIGDGAYPVLVVCPATMKLVWKDEFEKWAPDRRVTVVSGTPAKRVKQIATARDGEADVLVMNYELVREHTRIAGYPSVALTEKDKLEKELNEITWQTVIADEAHVVQDPTSKQSRALWWLSDNAANVFYLTGTGAENPEKTWCLMRGVYAPEYPGQTKFLDRYAQRDWNNFGIKVVTGLDPLLKDELFRFLDPRFIRRTREAVAPQLPPKIHSTRWVELGSLTKQGKAYEQMRKSMLAELDNGILLAVSPLVKLTRLRQFASASGELGEPSFDVRVDTDSGVVRLAGPFSSREQAEEHRDGQAYVHDLTPLLLTEPSCKIDALEEIVQELDGAKAVIFSESLQLLELAVKRLRKRGYNVARITGIDAELDRHLAIKEFQEGNAQLICVTLGAGGAGLTLDAADISIFLQRGFNLVQNMQAEDRVVQITKTTNIEIIDLITKGTIEEHVHKVLREKEERFQEIVRDEESVRAWLAK